MYYHKRLLMSTSYTKEYLQHVKVHLQRIVKENGWLTHGVKYARVRHLLGDPRGEVISTYQRALEAVKAEGCCYDQITALESFGRYYDISKEYSNALTYYVRAVNLSREKECRAWNAENGIRLISKYNPQCWAAYNRGKYQHFNRRHF